MRKRENDIVNNNFILTYKFYKNIIKIRKIKHNKYTEK